MARSSTPNLRTPDSRDCLATVLQAVFRTDNYSNTTDVDDTRVDANSWPGQNSPGPC